MDETPLLADERLFTRDLEGHLLRMDKPTAEMLDDSDDSLVAITVDGKQTKVPRAVPSTDAEGGIRYDDRGRAIPRLTTILDAVASRYGPEPSPVPVLCYREHMTPAAVCRVCLVQVAKRDKNGAVGEPDPKLAPSCHQPVVAGMVVETMGAKDADGQPTPGAKRVNKTVKLLVELLSANHLHRHAHPANELEALANRLEIDADGPGQTSIRFPRHKKFVKPAPDDPKEAKNPDPNQDDSSPWFIIDRTACILCDRCVRGCGEVRGHLVVARAGKGLDARIAFDWDQPMGESSCVKCGECFISCPTDAITMRPGVKPSPWDYEDEQNSGDGTPSGQGWLGRFLGPKKKDGPE